MAGFLATGPLFARVAFNSIRSRFATLPVEAVAGSLLSVLIYASFRGAVSGTVSRLTFAEFAAVFSAVQIILSLSQRRGLELRLQNAIERCRWMIVTAGALWLHQPLLFNGSVGAGDAYWYAIMVADFVTQWREGVFPVFVGQSEFAFNGAINPLRFAPGLQHLAGVVDLFTLRSLTFHGILNLTLVASFVGGALSCYGCLRAINPKAAWLAVIFSLLFSACPGVLALAYVGDLFMSVTTLPFVPLLIYGAWRTLQKADWTGMAIMVSAAAALWFLHPPIALWATAIATLTQLFRLWRDGRKRVTWLQWAGGAALFGALSCYSFISVSTLKIPAYPAFRPVILEDLKGAFPGTLAPINQKLGSLSDYQLGWTLWAALLAGVLAWAFTRPKGPSLAFIGAAILLLIFLVPIPRLLDSLWNSLPQPVVDITFMWPMQRIYVLLAGLAVFVAFLTLGYISTKNRFNALVILVAFTAGGWWSALEAKKLHARAKISTTPSIASRQAMLPQNRVLTRYSYNPFRSTPPYFSHGFVDPMTNHRLLAAETWKEITSNEAAIIQRQGTDTVIAHGNLACTQPDPASPTLVMTPKLELLPNRRYALDLEFAHPDFAGALTMRGTSLSRIYYLPDSGYGPKTATPSRAFGSLPGRPGTVTLWTDQSVPETITFQFFFSGAGPEQKIMSFGRYTFREISVATLPVQIESWSPYRARITAPPSTYLETPRIFLDGYQAKVNGRTVEVTKSPSALVMFAVPSGTSHVELSYRGPFVLRFAYYTSLTVWIALIGGLLLHRRRFASHEPSLSDIRN